MSHHQNYYEILGVSKDATSVEIRNAFKSLALTQHPDKGGTTDSFACLQEAYMVLYDSDKRKEYDNSNQIHETSTHEPESNNHFDHSEHEHTDHFDENCYTAEAPPHNEKPLIYQNINYQSSHIHMTITVTLDDIVKHKLFTIHPIRIVPCSVCRGNGIILHTIVDCVLCEGNGLYSNIIGDLMFCGRCRGSGKVIIESPPVKCPKCHGLRYFKKTFTFYISAYHVVGHSIKYPHKTPVIVFYGQGNYLYNKPCGDLVIHFNELSHPDYIRNQLNINYIKHITLYDALCGLTFDITTIQNKKLRIILDPILNLESCLDKTWFEQIIVGEGIEIPENNNRSGSSSSTNINSCGNGNLNIIFKIIIPNLSNVQKESLKKTFLSSQKTLKSPTKDTSIVRLNFVNTKLTN
jgi:molecular chaperone DnaJ